MKRTLALLPALVFVLFTLTSCKSVYYGAYEKFGVYKRDLLKKRVVAARDEQKEASVEFKDALTRLKEITKYEGGKLETRYRQLQADYEDCAQRVETVRKRISDVETVAEDLFTEWEKEIKQIGTDSLRINSRRQLNDTRLRYDEMISALKKAEATMPPVLTKFHDYVLALKHTLNAEAVASLKGESANIQSEITKLISEMNASISRADEFLKDLN
jgi:chromosome segregation ATPase